MFKRVRVALIVPLASLSGRYGGPYESGLDQAGLLQKSGEFDVAFVAPHLPNDAPEPLPSLLSTSAEVRPIIPGTGFLLLASRKAFSELKHQIDVAEIIHLTISRELYPLVALIMSLRAGKPFVVQPHGMLTARTNFVHKTIDLFLKPLLRKSNLAMALTPVEKDDLLRWFGRNPPPIEVLGNPISANTLATFAPIHEFGANEALFLARLHPRKRVEDFVNAAQIASANGWTEKYVVVGPDQGDGDLVRSAVERIVNLEYEGAIPGQKVAERLARSRVFVLPSLKEPWGKVLVDAISIGIPVVLTESAALAETIRESGAGVVVADHSPGDIASAVHDIVTMSQADYTAISMRARALAINRFGNEAVSMELVRILKSIRS